MNIELLNTTESKEVLIDKITLYDEKQNKEIITISHLDAKTNILNPIYNTIELFNITIKSLNIFNLKKKLKPNLSEKTAFYIVLSRDKIFNNIRIHLFLNSCYFESLNIKENNKKVEMQPGYFYFYDNVSFYLKNIEVTYYYYNVTFCKGYQEALKINHNYDAIHPIDAEIKKENELEKEIKNYKNNKYLDVLNKKLKEGFDFYVSNYKTESKNKDFLINIEVFNHSFKNDDRKKFENLENNLKNKFHYLNITTSELIDIFKYLNIDINKIDKKFLGGPENEKQ